MSSSQLSCLDLSSSEQRCLQALADGLSQKQAAIHLGLHIRTLEEHIRNARRRLNIETTFQLLEIAVHKQSIGVLRILTIKSSL